MAVLLAFAIILGGIPVGFLGADATGGHPCDVPEDCLVCTVANMINDLPVAEDININNAASVVQQIHAIDRVKFDLTDDEYTEMMELVETGENGSGGGLDVPTRYTDAVQAVMDLEAGGSLAVVKKYAVGNENLNWDSTDATVKIERIDEGASSFEPLSVTLANAPDSYLGFIGAYSENTDGWTNTYKLPAGTYKVTEIGYNAVTTDDERLTTTASYSVGGVETTDYAIVEVKEGQQSIVTLGNSYVRYSVNTYINCIGEGSISLMSLSDGDENHYPEEEMKITVTPQDGYVLHTLTAVLEQDNITLEKSSTENEFLFTMPSYDTTSALNELNIDAVFVPKTIDIGISDGAGNLLEGTLELYDGTTNVGSASLTSEDKVWEIDSTKLDLAKTYTIKQTTFADGYCGYDSTTYSIQLSDANGNVVTEGLTVDANTGAYTLINSQTQVVAHAVLESDTTAYLPGAKLQVLDPQGTVLEEWTSTEASYNIFGLKVGTEYTLKSADDPEGYYAEPSEKTFIIGANGKLTQGNTIPNSVDIHMLYKAYDKYVIALKEQAINYGDGLDIDSLIDFATSTFNGSPINDADVQSELLNALNFTVSDGERDYALDKVGELNVGTYTLKAELKDSSAYPLANFNIVDETLKIDKRALNAGDFEITAEEKVYDGQVEATLTATIKSTVPGIKNSLMGVISGSFDDASVGNGKTINYLISGLSGYNNETSNYTLQGGFITGQTTGDITAKPIETVNISLQEPVAAVDLASSVTVTTDAGAASSTISWKIGGDDTSGKAAYNTTYTATIELTADSNFKFADTTSIKVNNEDVDFTITQDGKLVITKDYKTAKAKLTGFEPLTKITGANGVSVDDLKTQLPSEIKLVTEDASNEYKGTITWDVNDFGSYDPSNRNKQTFTVKGEVTLPASIDQNQLSLEVGQEFEIASKTERTITVTTNSFGLLNTTDKYTGTEIHYAGNEISVAATPNQGYVLHTLTVKTVSGGDITVNQGEFTMPDEDVTINAVFVPEKVNIAVVDEGGNDLASAKLEVRDENNTSVATSATGALVIDSKTLTLGKTYTVVETTVPSGYYCPQDTYNFVIGTDGIVTYNGLEKDSNSGIFLLKNKGTKVSVSAVDEADGYVENADLTIYDSNNNPVENWKSTAAPKAFSRLSCGEYYIVANNTDDYYPATSEKINFVIGQDGKVTKDGTAEYENGIVKVVFKKYDKYDILLADQSIKYGDSLDKTSLVDFALSKLNGSVIGDAEQSKLLDALTFTLVKDTNVYALDKAKELSVGEYTLKAELNNANEYPHSKFNIGEAKVKIEQGTLTADDFDISVTEKEYDGGSEAMITATLKEIVPGIKDDIKVIISGTYDDVNVGDGITIDYIIGGLESESGLADNYKFEGEAITGQTTGSIVAKTIENINVTFDKPEGNKDLATSVAVTSDDDAVTGTISWKAGDETVSGKVEYDVEYTAIIELSTDGNHLFTEEDTKLKVNGEESAFAIVDGKLVIEMKYKIANPNINMDTDGDGKPDVNIDTDGDGKPDVNIDTDGDGKPDVNVDTDGDGKPDVNIDTDGDGKPDVNIDTDGDGKPDVNIDTDGDGKPDVNIDTDGDGKPDVNIDTDGDGKPDVNIDTDGDGKPDVNIDTDGDGKPDVNIDTDGDGKPDVNIDTDGDSKPDNEGTEGNKPGNGDAGNDNTGGTNQGNTGAGNGGSAGTGNGGSTGTGNVSGGSADQSGNKVDLNSNATANGNATADGNAAASDNATTEDNKDSKDDNDSKDEESVDAFKEGVEEDDSEDKSKDGIGDMLWIIIILAIIVLTIFFIILWKKNNEEEDEEQAKK